MSSGSRACVGDLVSSPGTSAQWPVASVRPTRVQQQQPLTSCLVSTQSAPAPAADTAWLSLIMSGKMWKLNKSWQKHSCKFNYWDMTGSIEQIPYTYYRANTIYERNLIISLTMKWDKVHLYLKGISMKEIVIWSFPLFITTLHHVVLCITLY